MHLCKSGSDCDLNVYKSDEGFDIEIPRTRILSDDEPPAPPPGLEETDPRQWLIMRARIHDWVEVNHQQITLPHAGEWLLEPDLDRLRVRLLELRALGYRIPDRVFEDIQAWKDGDLPERSGALILAQKPMDRNKLVQRKRNAARRARQLAQTQSLEADEERLLAFAARLDKEAEALEQIEPPVTGPPTVQQQQVQQQQAADSPPPNEEEEQK